VLQVSLNNEPFVMNALFARVNKVATVILTVAGLALIPSRVLDATGSWKWAALSAVVVFLSLGVPAGAHLFRPSFQRRFGIGRYATRVIVTRRFDEVAISEDFVGEVNTLKDLVFCGKPEAQDLVDIIDVLPGKEIDESVYRSLDSTPVEIVRRKNNAVAIFWKPKNPIQSLVPYSHDSHYRCPSLYGPEGFYQAYYVDCETGISEWAFKCSQPIQHAIAFTMPAFRSQVTEKRLYKYAFKNGRRNCEQPTVDRDRRTIRWTLNNPQIAKTLVLFAFYDGGQEKFLKDIRDTFWTARVMRAMRLR
jgi:hypothetical protein